MALSFLPKALEASGDKIKADESIFDLGARGDGLSDDTLAFREWFARHDHLQLPPGKCFVIGDLDLHGKSLCGPGIVRMKKGAKSTFILKGNFVRLINIQFISTGTGRRPEAEIILASGLSHAMIQGCSFNGELFNSIGCGVNSEKDKSIITNEPRSFISITNNHFKGRYSHHLYLHLIDNLIVSNNFFENSSHDSIRLRQLVKTITITHNQFKNIGHANDKDSKDGIDCFWSGHQLIITDNHFENVETHGIDLKGHSPDLDYGTSRVNISGNQFRKIGFSGILISSGEKSQGAWKAIKNVSVINNHFEGCGYASSNPNDAALFLRHNQEMIIISSNQFYRNFNKAVMVGNFAVGAPVSRDIIIQNNLLSSNCRKKISESYGIHVLGGIGIVIHGNIITNDKDFSELGHTKGIVVEKYNQYPIHEVINKDNLTRIT